MGRASIVELGVEASSTPSSKTAVFYRSQSISDGFPEKRFGAIEPNMILIQACPESRQGSRSGRPNGL